jgi:hypothetical protein
LSFVSCFFSLPSWQSLKTPLSDYIITKRDLLSSQNERIYQITFDYVLPHHFDMSWHLFLPPPLLSFVDFHKEIFLKYNTNIKNKYFSIKISPIIFKYCINNIIKKKKRKIYSYPDHVDFHLCRNFIFPPSYPYQKIILIFMKLIE